MKPFLLLPVLLLLVPAIRQENAVAQSKTDLVGTWKLLSVSYVMDNGQTNKEPYGPHPTGLITYTADDRMACRHQQAKEQRRSRPPLPMVDDTLLTATK